jgi:hypothetical protein
MNPFAPDEAELEVERIRRMGQAWRALRPDPAEAAAARSRFEARRKARRRLRIAPAAMVLAALFIAAAASGASRLATFVSQLTRVSTTESADGASGVSTPARHAPRRAEAPGPTVKPAATAEQGTTSAIGPLAASPGTATPPEPVLSPHGNAVRRRRHTASMETEGSSPRPASSTSRAWEVAAAALRVGDSETAERAFASLTESPDLRTRDAARLARAQLWLSQGRVVDARAELEDLAARGTTALVRTRAAEALRDLPW